MTTAAAATTTEALLRRYRMNPTPPEIWYGLQPEPYLPAVNVSGSGDLGKFGARSLPADRGGEGHRSSGVPVVVAHPALHVVGIFVPALRDEVEPLVCRVEHVDAARVRRVRVEDSAGLVLVEDARSLAV